MPKLQGISLSHSATGGGIPWEAIHAVVQVPQLRFLEFHGRLDHRHTIPTETEQSLRLPVHCLNTINYPTTGYYKVSATEAKMIFVLLRQSNTQRSLENLSLPNECAPLECFCADKFPRLRQLTLIGRRQVSVSHPHPQGCIPHISILVNMPRLQKLVLTLSQPISLPRQAIWPAGTSAEFPCPELRELSVCHPHPDDEFYAHLPPTLRRLALRCWPRHYQTLLDRDHKELKRLGWYSPILSSSEMLRILRRCPSRDVRQLDIEFEEDDSGGDLFRCIPDVFPQLQYLVLHRYRRAGVDATPIAAMAQALAPLCSLRVFLCNPDFEDAPILFGADPNPPFAPLIATLHRTANIFASSLAPSVQAVGFLVRQDIWARYFYFRIMRNGDGTVRTKDDQFVLDKLGISVDEVSSLPHL